MATHFGDLPRSTAPGRARFRLQRGTGANAWGFVEPKQKEYPYVQVADCVAAGADECRRAITGAAATRRTAGRSTALASTCAGRAAPAGRSSADRTAGPRSDPAGGCTAGQPTAGNRSAGHSTADGDAAGLRTAGCHAAQRKPGRAGRHICQQHLAATTGRATGLSAVFCHCARSMPATRSGADAAPQARLNQPQIAIQ